MSTGHVNPAFEKQEDAEDNLTSDPECNSDSSIGSLSDVDDDDR